MGRNATKLLCRSTGINEDVKESRGCCCAACLQAAQPAPPSTVPSFYKILTESIVTREYRPKLHIPYDFVKAHAEELSSSIQLEGSNGKTWFVRICAHRQSTIIRQGWSIFSTDNKLEKGDVLIFLLIGKGHFLVRIFDKLGCQKETDHQIQKPNLFKSAFIRNRSDHHSSNKRKSHIDVNELPSYEEFGHNNVLHGMEGLSICETCTQKFKYRIDYNNMQQCFSSTSTKLEKDMNELKKAKRAPFVYASNFPSVRKVMSRSEVSKPFLLAIPKQFAVESLPKKDAYAKLVDSCGRKWVAKWIANPHVFSGGWRRFAKDNHLEKGDVCVLEVINKDELVLKVQIFRGTICDLQ